MLVARRQLRTRSRVWHLAALVAVLWPTNGFASPPGTEADGSDPLPTPLHLGEAVRLAAWRRAEIAAARARVRAAAERPTIVSALEDPIVSPSLDHLPLEMHGADVSLTLEQRLPLSGVRGHLRSAAEADVRRHRAEAARTGLDVELDAASAFLMLVERREMARLLGEQHGLADQVVRAATARYAAGTGPQADVLQAEIERARLAGARRASTAEIRGAEAMLNVSLGRAATAPVPPLVHDASDAPPPPAPAVVAAALRARPELAGGAAEVARAEADVAVMRSMYGPMAMVRTGPAYTMSEGPGWMAMVGISVPLWRGRLRAGVAEARAMVDMARADLDAMRRMAAGESLARREALAAARERYLVLRDDVLPRAERAVQPTLAAYASGQLPLVSVLGATQSLRAVQAELLMAEVALALARVRLDRAMGAPIARRGAGG